MTLALQVALVVVLYVALPLGFSWLSAYTYAFWQPLDRLIDEDRVGEFRLAGAAFGVVAATIVCWWMPW